MSPIPECPSCRHLMGLLEDEQRKSNNKDYELRTCREALQSARALVILLTLAMLAVGALTFFATAGH